MTSDKMQGILTPQLWQPNGVFKMANDTKYTFRALGIFLLGYSLERLEWALATVTNSMQLATYVEPFRMYEEVKSFGDIGIAAKYYHDLLSSQKTTEVSDSLKNALRAARTTWEALAKERLEDLYLVTPAVVLDAKVLMSGITGFLPSDDATFLVDLVPPIEHSDLNEACACILIGSATAGEYIALRAAENLLRRWYLHQTGKTIERGTWGIVLDRLEEEYPPKSRPKELALLGYLKLRRDEVAHPERVSTLIETQTTILNVCGLITGIRPVLAELPSIPSPQNPLAMPNPALQLGPGSNESVLHISGVRHAT